LLGLALSEPSLHVTKLLHGHASLGPGRERRRS
jgi:hypothetical protein